MAYILRKSTRKDKKFQIITPNGKIIHFGAKGYSDFPTHQDEQRREAYIKRHHKKENWTKTGINTAGFWSYWILWNEPTLMGSIKKVEKLFKIQIQLE